MRKNSRCAWIFGPLHFVCLCVSALCTSNAGAVIISAPEQTIQRGASVDAIIAVDDLNGVTIAGYDLLLGYDPSILNLQGVNFSNALSTTDGDSPEIIVDEIAIGQINIASLNLFGTNFSNQDGSTPFNLFTVSFDAIAIGSSQLTLTPNTFGSGVFFTDPLGQTLLETSVDGRIDVTQQAVGEPGTLALGLFALLVAWTTNIRRRHYLQPH